MVEEKTNLENVNKTIHAIVASMQEGCTQSKILNEYRTSYGPLNWVDLGFRSFDELLMANTKLLSRKMTLGGEKIYEARQGDTEASRDIQDQISKQRAKLCLPSTFGYKSYKPLNYYGGSRSYGHSMGLTYGLYDYGYIPESLLTDAGRAQAYNQPYATKWYQDWQSPSKAVQNKSEMECKSSFDLRSAFLPVAQTDLKVKKTPKKKIEQILLPLATPDIPLPDGTPPPTRVKSSNKSRARQEKQDETRVVQLSPVNDKNSNARFDPRRYAKNAKRGKEKMITAQDDKQTEAFAQLSLSVQSPPGKKVKADNVRLSTSGMRRAPSTMSICSSSKFKLLQPLSQPLASKLLPRFFRGKKMDDEIVDCTTRSTR